MTNDAIFLVSDAGELQRIEHQLYGSEAILQQLVGKHPQLLAGDQIDPEAPPLLRSGDWGELASKLN